MSLSQILVVDDDESFREALVWRLEKHGYEILQCRSGIEALKKLKLDRFRCVVSDVRMPGMSGIELLDKSQKFGLSKPPFILMTGQSDVSCIEALKLGADAVFSKPFDSDHFLHILREILVDRESSDGREVSVSTVLGDTWLKLQSGFTTNQSSPIGKVTEVKRNSLLAYSADAMPDLKQIVNLSLTSECLPEDLNGFSIDGEIRWARRFLKSRFFKFSFGIEFLSTSEQAKRAISTLIHFQDSKM